jgi:hypothetical protein
MIRGFVDSLILHISISLIFVYTETAVKGSVTSYADIIPQEIRNRRKGFQRNPDT